MQTTQQETILPQFMVKSPDTDKHVSRMAHGMRPIFALWRAISADIAAEFKDRDIGHLEHKVSVFKDKMGRKCFSLECLHTRPNPKIPGDTSTYSVGDVLIRDDGHLSFCDVETYDYEQIMGAIVCNLPIDETYKQTLLEAITDKTFFNSSLALESVMSLQDDHEKKTGFRTKKKPPKPLASKKPPLN